MLSDWCTSKTITNFIIQNSQLHICVLSLVVYHLIYIFNIYILFTNSIRFLNHTNEIFFNNNTSKAKLKAGEKTNLYIHATKCAQKATILYFMYEFSNQNAFLFTLEYESSFLGIFLHRKIWLSSLQERMNLVSDDSIFLNLFIYLILSSKVTFQRLFVFNCPKNPRLSLPLSVNNK